MKYLIFDLEPCKTGLMHIDHFSSIYGDDSGITLGLL